MIVGGCVLLLVSFGIRHSSGLYLIPISDHIQTGREVFGFAIAIQFLMIGIGSPIFGAIADKYGSSIAGLYGAIFFLIGLYMMSLVEGSGLLIVSQVIFGFGCAGCGTAVILGAPRITAVPHPAQPKPKITCETISRPDPSTRDII